MNYKKPRINIFFAVYTLYALVCMLIDYFSLGKYYIVRENNIFNLGLLTAKYVYIVASGIIIVGLLCLFIDILVKNNELLINYLHFPKVSRTDVGVMFFFFIITMYRLPFPDRSFDTINYHLFLQNFHFENNVTYNFFPANIQTFTYPLGDRLFYIFRLMLGYRGGVLLNTLVLIILYFQVKSLIRIINRGIFQLKSEGYLLSILAMFVLSSEYVLANLGIYMIDLLMLPFLLELVVIAIGDKTNPEFTLFYSVFLCGLSVSIKLTSLVFCSCLILVIFLRYIKSITWKSLIVSPLLFILPIIVYITYTTTQTSNPVFPYYFQSRLGKWDVNAALASRNAGPNNLLEYIIWPIYIYFDPIRTVQLGHYSGRLGIGLIFTIVYTAISFSVRAYRRLIFGLLFLMAIYLWVFTSGMIRYGLFLEILAGVILVDTLVMLLNIDIDLLKTKMNGFNLAGKVNVKNKNLSQFGKNLLFDFYSLEIKSYFVKMLIVLIVFASLAQIVYASYLTFYKPGWSQRPTPQSRWNFYKENLKMIGKDYKPLPGSIKDEFQPIVDEVDVWIVAPGEITTGYEFLLKDTIPILNLNMVEFSKMTETAYLESMKRVDLGSKDIYTLTRQRQSLAEITSSLNDFGYKVLEVYEIHPTYSYSQLNLIKLELLE